MSCSRGEATPNQHTKLMLFADSAGFCQNPSCVRALFLEIGAERLHIAEMAHIFAASDTGPRADPTMSASERGAYENLILLCSSCHTIVDKASNEYPDNLILSWKQMHKEKIAEVFGVVKYGNRYAVRQVIEPLLEENRLIFENYGPMTDERFNPESGMPTLWRRKIFAHILPNNRKILHIINANREHLNSDERKIVVQFSLHVDDFEAKHLSDTTTPSGLRFPEEMNRIFS